VVADAAAVPSEQQRDGAEQGDREGDQSDRGEEGHTSTSLSTLE
jgi:hypothetical protein